MTGDIPPPKSDSQDLGTSRNSDPLTSHQLWALKSELNKNTPIEKAFETFRSLRELGPDATLARRPVLYWQDHLASDASYCVMIDPGKEGGIMPAPRILGAKNIPDIVGQTRPIFAALFENVTVTSRSSAIQLESGDYIFDMQPSSGLEIDMSWEPFVFQHEGEAIWCIDSESQDDLLHMQEVISLLGGHPGNFGHWMLEHISQLLCLLSLPQTRGLPILIDQNIPSQHREAVELIAGPEHQVIEVSFVQKVRCEKVWVCSTPIYSPKILWKINNLSHLAYSTATPAKLMQKAWAKIDAQFGLENGGRSRTFLARSERAKRKLLNIEEVSDTLEKSGFQTILPESLSFKEQFRIIRNSDQIVLQSGSAMFALFLCRPGTRVLFLTNSNLAPLPSWNAMMQALEIELTVVAGELGDGKFSRSDVADYSIPLSLLRKGFAACKFEVPDGM